MLQLFDSLSNVDGNVRAQAVADLTNHLIVAQKQSEAPSVIAHEDVTYAVARLTRGLASSHNASRQGFATCLCEVLARIAIVQPEQVIEEMNKHMSPSGSTKSEEEKQMYIGQVFTIGALVKSGRLLGRKSVNKRLVSTLLEISSKKSYLPEICFHTICELAVSVCKDSKSFSSIVLKRVAPLIQGVAPQDVPPEILAFLLVGQSHFGLKVKQFHPQWISEEVMAEEHWPLLMNCFKNSSYTHPQVHMMWPLIVDGLFAEGEAHAMSFYRQVVETGMFGSHVDSRKYLAFLIAEQFILRAETGVVAVETLSGSNSRRCMFNHSNKSTTKLFKVATRCLEALVEHGQQDSLFAEQVLEELLQSERWENFDALTRSKTGKILAASLEDEERTQWTTALLDQYMNPISPGKRKLALESLSSVLKSERQVKDNERIFTAVQRLSVAAYCKTEASLSDSEIKSLKLQVANIIGESKSSELAWTALRAIDKNGGGKLVDDWKSVLKEKKKLKSFANQDLSNALSELLAVTAFRLLEGNDDEEFVEDMIRASSHLRKSGGDTSQPALVLSGLITQLMTESSSLYRKFCGRAFSVIASMTPTEGILDIVEAIVTDEDMDLELEESEDDDGDDDNDDDGAPRAMEEEEDKEPESDDSSSSEEGDNNIMNQLISLDDADPEQLKLLDEKIAAVVRETRNQTKSSRKAQMAQLSDFKCRVLDLYDVFLLSKPDPLILCESIPKLLHKARILEMKINSAALHARLCKTLEVVLAKNAKVPKLKKSQVAQVNKTLLAIVQKAAKWNPTETASKLFAAVISFFVRAVGDKLDLNALRPLMGALYQRVLLKKNSRLAHPERFFNRLYVRLPGLGLATLSSFAPVLSSSKGSPSVKCRALRSLLDVLFRSSTGKQWLLDHPKQFQAHLPSVAALCISWLKAEIGRSLSSQEFAITLQAVNAIFNFQRDPRFLLDKSEMLSLVQPSTIMSTLTAVIDAHPHLLKSKKVVSVQKNLTKTLSK